MRNSFMSNLKQQRWFQILIVLLVLLGGFMIIRKIRTDKKKRGESLDNSEDAGGLIGTGMYDNQAQALQRILELKEIAQKMSEAFWNFRVYAWGSIVLWRTDEDEDMFIQEANRLQNAKEAQLVSDYYREYNTQWDTSTLLTPQKGLSLKADMNKFLSSSELSRIPSFVKNSVK